MAPTIESVEADALQLSERERFELIERLSASLPMDPEIEAAWALEIKRRLEDLASGRVQTIPWDEANEVIEQDLTRHRADRASS
jgi:putative addiction module component (TIGR02574 family)